VTTTETPPVAETTLTIDRDALLRPVLAQIEPLLVKARESEHAVRLRIEPHAVEVSPWERDVVLDVLAGERTETNTTPYRVVEAIAWQVRVLGDLQRLAKKSAEERDTVRGDLYRDAVLGTAIYQELQQIVGALVVSGKRDAVQPLSQLQNKVNRALKLVRQELPPELANGLRDAAASLVSVPDEARLEAPPEPKPRRRRRPAEAQEQPADVTIRVHRPAAKDGGPGLAHVVLLVLGTALLVGGLVFALTGKPRQVEPTDLAMQPGIVSVAGEAPAFEVTVDPLAWRGMDEGARTRLVFSVASVIKKKGYTTARFVLPDGRVVAEWEKGKRVRFSP